MEKSLLIKKCFIWSFIFGIAAHGFCFFNTLFNHDSTMIYLSDDEWKASLGRYADPVYRVFRSRYSAPWLTGILAISFLALAAYLIARMFDINKSAFIICICGLLTTNYSLIFTNAFCIHDTDSYMFAILLAVASAFCITSLKAKRIIRIILGGITLAASMAIYQAYVTFPFAIILIYMVLLMLKNSDFKILLNQLLDSAATYICGALVYVIGLKLYTKFAHIELESSGHNSITGVFSLENWHFISSTKNTYRLFYEYFFEISKYNRFIMVPLNIIIITAIISIIIISLIKRPVNFYYYIFIALICILYPVVLSALCVISTELGHLMKFQFFSVYLFAIVLIIYFADNRLLPLKKITGYLPLASLVIIFYLVYNNIAFANGLYLSKVLEYQTTRELMTRVIDDIEDEESFIPGETKVLFVGSPYSSAYYNIPRSGYGQMGGSGIAGLELYTSVTGYYTYYDFIKEIMNERLEIGSSEEAYIISSDSRVVEMPVYPQKGSVSTIDDTIVVKFSEYPIP